MTGPGSLEAGEIRRQLERLARSRGLLLDRVIQDYAVERFLYRLAASPWADRFLVKGAALLRLWGGPTARPTRDIDFCGLVDGSPEVVASAIRDCLNVDVPEDGLVFASEVESDAIMVGGRYPGVRVVLRAELAGARVKLQLDVGIGDAVVPEAGWIDYPVLLDLPHPRIRAYSPATSVAEKLHTMVDWGLANSRMKDYYDLWFLASRVEFDGPQLVAAIAATFGGRDTVLKADLPIALTSSYWGDREAARRWGAFASGVGQDPTPSLQEAVEIIARFIGPAIESAATGKPFKYRWASGGPWVPVA